MNYYEYFDTPSTGECFEYEALIGNLQLRDEKDFEFGFCSGESPVLSFYVKNSKLYDNDRNFVYQFGKGEYEIYGNVFAGYHNYSIDRVPVNLNCSKTVQPEGKNYIDGAYSNTTGIAFLIKAYGESAPVEGYGESP